MEEYYDELKNIENWIWDKIHDSDELLNSKLGEAWSNIYDYLKEIKPDNE